MLARLIRRGPTLESSGEDIGFCGSGVYVRVATLDDPAGDEPVGPAPQLAVHVDEGRVKGEVRITVRGQVQPRANFARPLLQLGELHGQGLARGEGDCEASRADPHRPYEKAEAPTTRKLRWKSHEITKKMAPASLASFAVAMCFGHSAHLSSRAPASFSRARALAMAEGPRNDLDQSPEGRMVSSLYSVGRSVR